MFLAVISPSVIRGTLTPPPQTAAHRLLSPRPGGEGGCELSLSADMEATLRAVRGLGVSVRLDGDAALFRPRSPVLFALPPAGGLRRERIHPALSHSPVRRPGYSRRLHRPRPAAGAPSGGVRRLSAPHGVTLSAASACP